MKNYTQSQLEKLRNEKEPWLNTIGVEASGIGLDKGGNVCLRLWCAADIADVRNAIASNDLFKDVPVDLEQSSGFVIQNVPPPQADQ